MNNPTEAGAMPLFKPNHWSSGEVECAFREDLEMTTGDDGSERDGAGSGRVLDDDADGTSSLPEVASRLSTSATRV
jgi:hypothetical protein